MSDYLALPDEVVVETILWRLPVKSIIQCRCVCKSWYSLITSPNFISTHLRKSLTKNPQIFLHERNIHDRTGSCSLLFDNQDYFRSMLFHLRHPLLSPSICIVGSINGLICYSIWQGDASRSGLMSILIVCNPSIGHFRLIPSPYPSEICWPYKGFGFDERTQDYKILVLSPGKIGKIGKIGFIYSLNSHCWRHIPNGKIGSIGFIYSLNSAVFVNGRFHWLDFVLPNVKIIFFDLKTEAFGRISLPECLEHCVGCGQLHIMESWESSIAILNREPDEKSIWIMEEYGSVKSWRNFKLAPYPRGEVIGFRNKDEMLVQCQNIDFISSQKINKKKLEKLVYKHPLVDYTVHKYVPSLALLDKENNVDVTAPTHTIVDLASPTRIKRDISAPTRRKRIKSNSQS